MIEDAKIKIRFGPIKWTVKIDEIRKINKVKNPFSAPALSINRLEVQYGKDNIVNNIPQKRTRFYKTITKRKSSNTNRSETSQRQ
ncbi:PH domain-containing protein [Aquibacillus rhizosphaerae]|uniref:PH domain-containing protein n=1 Tax=Aquibacillus rhizosphaerae TaxID=3051431 RepID=A0ABT7L0V9_9BACI|nr:PH domain-containing protein [Aquibacillus sp. LR5S19]MDL4839445.1 PH domain-containing protein [Aquibacillus sp. LR5S19]